MNAKSYKFVGGSPRFKQGHVYDLEVVIYSDGLVHISQPRGFLSPFRDTKPYTYPSSEVFKNNWEAVDGD